MKELEHENRELKRAVDGTLESTSGKTARLTFVW
jgi:hypothetical protein